MVCGPQPRVATIYSDASFEEGTLRLGWICFIPGIKPLTGWYLPGPFVRFGVMDP